MKVFERKVSRDARGEGEAPVLSCGRPVPFSEIDI